MASATGLLLVATGILHVSAAADHTNLPVMLAGFLLMATVQAAFGALLVARRPSRVLLLGAALVTSGAIGTWLLSRTIGLPFLPGGHMEPIGFKDGVTVLLEVATLPGLALLASRELLAVTVPPHLARQALAGLGTGVFLLFVPALVLGGGGHHSAEQMAAGGHGHGEGEELASSAGGGHGHGGGSASADGDHGGHDDGGGHEGSAPSGHRKGHGHGAGGSAVRASSGTHSGATHRSGHGAHGGGGYPGGRPGGSDHRGDHGSERGKHHGSERGTHHGGRGGKGDGHGKHQEGGRGQGDGHGKHDDGHGSGGHGSGGHGSDDHGGGGSGEHEAKPAGVAFEAAEPGRDGKPGRGSAVVLRGGRDDKTNGAGHSHSAPCKPTAAQEAYAERLYRATAAEIRKYDNNPLRAMADGFTYVFGPTDREIHMVNLRRLQDPTVLEPSEIESFLYVMTDRGYVPVAGMYIMPEYGMRGPQPGGCRTKWHHHGGVIGRWATAGTSDNTPEMMHVWTYPGLDPWGHYDGRDMSQLWKPGSFLPSVCRESGDANDGCFG